tara:strand:+ start:8308 stop:9258 length:951 start_codon:yes stop_codon:yes gene_type:complete
VDRLVNGKSLESTIYLLVDNGSLEASATLNLRSVARIAGLLAGLEIHPVSLLHSSSVDPSLLDGEKAQVMQEFLSGDLGQSARKLQILPFFFGPSRALSEWLPEKLKIWRQGKQGREFCILDPLHRSGDDRLSIALAELCLESIRGNDLKDPFLALVDHGTPVREVHEVREEIGGLLKERMSGRISGFSTCSMERRAGAEYDFNEPLLENLLKEKKSGCHEMLVAQLFLSPGRHAGEGGDLEQICTAFTDDSSVTGSLVPRLWGHILWCWRFSWKGFAMDHATRQKNRAYSRRSDRLAGGRNRKCRESIFTRWGRR